VAPGLSSPSPTRHRRRERDRRVRPNAMRRRPATAHAQQQRPRTRRPPNLPDNALNAAANVIRHVTSSLRGSGTERATFRPPQGSRQRVGRLAHQIASVGRIAVKRRKMQMNWGPRVQSRFRILERYFCLIGPICGPGGRGFEPHRSPLVKWLQMGCFVVLCSRANTLRHPEGVGRCDRRGRWATWGVPVDVPRVHAPQLCP